MTKGRASNDRLSTPSREAERMSWARLVDDHDRIARHCRDLRALTRRRGMHCEQASRKLLELAVMVADHLGVEDEVADLVVTAMALDQSQAAIDAMQAELDMLKTDWKAFIVQWLPAITPSDWLAFRVDSEAICERLTRRVGEENALLYDTALRLGVVGLGDVVLH